MKEMSALLMKGVGIKHLLNMSEKKQNACTSGRTNPVGMATRAHPALVLLRTINKSIFRKGQDRTPEMQNLHQELFMRKPSQHLQLRAFEALAEPASPQRRAAFSLY